MAYTITRTNYLEVNSVPLSTPAWWITNLETEMNSFPAVRGSDLMLPGAAGVRGRKRRLDVTVKQLQLVIVGNVKFDGTTHANPSDGLSLNIADLRTNLGLAYATGNGTVTAIWHWRNGTTKTAAVHVLGLHLDDLGKRHANGVLELSIPAGEFV